MLTVFWDAYMLTVFWNAYMLTGAEGKALYWGWLEPYVYCVNTVLVAGKSPSI
jgi:hypothetical protein